MVPDGRLQVAELTSGPNRISIITTSELPSPLRYLPCLVTNSDSSHHHHHHHHGQEDSASPTATSAQVKNLKGSTPTAAPNEKGAAGHHHHHHHHGQRPGQSAQAVPAKPAAAVIPPKTKTIITSKAVTDAVANRPRHHLGDFIYEPHLKAGRLLPNTPTHRGFSSNPTPLPWNTIKDKENCTLTVKVPHVHLSPVAREEITARAFLWGTDVYTDDSDVVAACIHGGWIKGEWTEDVDTAMLDLDGRASGTDANKRKPKSQPNGTVDANSEDIISAPPPSGPMSIRVGRDLHVNVLILPRLSKYSATTRHGMTSREFGGQFGSRHAVHDGISFMVQNIRWVENGAQPQARLRGKARRERMRKAMKEVTASFGNINGMDLERDKQRTPSTRGDIAVNWRKKDQPEGQSEIGEKTDAARATSEGDKENRATVSTQAAQPEATPDAAAPEAAKNAPEEDITMAEADEASKTAAVVQGEKST